jgi:hypothetical protein
MLSIPLTRILIAGTLGAVSAGAVASPDISPRSLGSFQARLTGATAATLRGSVAVGNPQGDAAQSTFVITLGVGSEDGVVILTRRQGSWPEPGTYPISDTPSAGGFSALVVAGSLAKPRGVFRAERGTLTITHRSPEAVAGQFELRGRGFLAAAPERENRKVEVEGTFLGVAQSAGVALR